MSSQRRSSLRCFTLDLLLKRATGGKGGEKREKWRVGGQERGRETTRRGGGEEEGRDEEEGAEIKAERTMLSQERRGRRGGRGNFSNEGTIGARTKRLKKANKNRRGDAQTTQI